MKEKGRCLLAISLFVIVFAFTVPSLRSQTVAAQLQDDECIACHGQNNLQSAIGRSVYVDLAAHKAGVHANLKCATCHTDITDFPHPAEPKHVECSTCHAQEAHDFPSSVHTILGAEGCATCHGSAHDARPLAALPTQLCGSCHAAELTEFLSSAHGAAMQRGDSEAPTCLTCHGSAHRIVSVKDPRSPIAKQNQPVTCASCHANSGFLARHQTPLAHPVQSYQLSVHGRALAAGKLEAPSCSDCHSAHAIKPASDMDSSVNHWNIPATCSGCHGEVAKTYSESVHGQAVAHGVFDSPVCTDCHGDHAILTAKDPRSLVNPLRVSFTTCGRCHGDERIAERYNLPADRLSTFASSFHGLATRAGSSSVANCASCHGTHNIFPSSDPRSTIHPANLSRTCGNCHGGAGQTFAIGTIHIDRAAGNEAKVVRWIRLTYWLLIPLILGFMFFHHSLDFLRKFRDGRHPHPPAGEQVMRMNLHFRIAHWLTMGSFPVLIVTGFALRFPESWWAQPMLVWEGRFAFRGTMHRIAAVLLLASLVYHVLHLLVVRRDRMHWRAMLPSWQDFRDLRAMVLYNLRLSPQRPTFGRFNYVEKIEYWAFVWGVMIMAVTGCTLWFNNLALRYFPKWVSDAATALHFYEAILATAAICIWHMYTVGFDPEVYPMDRAWLTGKTSAAHLRNTRPAYYAEVVGTIQPVAPEQVLPAGEPNSPSQEPPESSESLNSPASNE